MLIERDEGTAARRRVPFRLFTSDGTSPDTGAAGDAILMGVNSATTITLVATATAIHAARGMYYVELSQSNCSVLGVHPLYHVAGDFPHHVANIEVINSNPYSILSALDKAGYTILAGAYSNVTFSTGGQASSSVTLAPGTHSNVSILGVTRLDSNVTLRAGVHSDATITGVQRLDSNVTLRAGTHSDATITGVVRLDSSVTPRNALYSQVTVRIDPINYSGMSITGVTRLDSNVTLNAGTHSGATIRGVEQLVTNLDKTDYTISAAGRSAIAQDSADSVWDEDIVAAHGGADSAGRAIRTLDSIGDRTNNPTLAGMLGVPDQANRSVHQHLLETKDYIERLRPGHSGRGDTWYVDPVNGNDSTGDGSRAAPFATVGRAQTSATTGNGDVIMLIAGSTVGVTTLNEQVTLSKRDLSIRGPGRTFLWKASSTGDVITVTGENIELSGFQAGTHTVGSGDAIVFSATANDGLCQDLFIEATQGEGIFINGADNVTIRDCELFSNGLTGAGNSIQVDGGALDTRIFNNIIVDSQNDAIRIANPSTSRTRIRENVVYKTSGFGVNITNGTDALVVDNIFEGNNSGPVLDSGTSSRIFLKESLVLKAGIAQGGSASGVTFDTAASALNDFYNHAYVVIKDGTGKGQVRLISDYTGASKDASVARPWVTVPDSTSKFQILADGTAQVVGITAATYSGVTISGVERTNNVTALDAGIIGAAQFGPGAIDAAALATDAGQEIADRILARNIAGGSDTTRIVTDALRALRNRVQLSATSFVVYQEDDATIAWQASRVTTAASVFNTEIDPT